MNLVIYGNIVISFINLLMFQMNNNKYLPNQSWIYQQSLYSNFNNNLLSGINSGLSLYDPEYDKTLYKPLDTKTLQNTNFDDINIRLKKNDDIYENVKSVFQVCQMVLKK